MRDYLPAAAEGLALLLWVTLVGFLLVVAVMGALGHADTAPLVGALLIRPQPIDRVVPILILALAAWVAGEIAIRARAVRGELRAAQSFERFVADGTGANDIPANTRAASRVAQMRGDRQKLSTLYETLPAAAALDASTLAGCYTTLQIWTWAFPVLGFIGTALGLASSIAGFSDALRETTRIEVLVERLSQLVIPGLASAFETTVLALTLSLIAYLCSGVLQAADWRALERLDTATLRVVERLPRPEVSGAPDDRIIERLDAVAVLLRSLSARGEEFQGLAQEMRTAAIDTKQAAADLKAASQDLHASITLPYHVTIRRGDSR